MSKIKRSYPHPEIQKDINRIKMMGYDRVAHEIEKQITLTIMKGGALFHIAERAREELEKIIEHDEYFTKNRNNGQK